MNCDIANICEKVKAILPWKAEPIEDVSVIPQGDMPGDKVLIGKEHVKKAEAIFPGLLELLLPVFKAQPCQRTVISVCGTSGVGKSEIASLLTYHLNRAGIGSYTLSGDNYPHRIPKYNDAERLRVFRQTGIRGLIAHGLYGDKPRRVLSELQQKGEDADPAQCQVYPWLSLYQREGRSGLKNYLGTSREINFDELNGIISQFKNGVSDIYLKRMGRVETELWYDAVDFRDIHVLTIEWTHGNSDNLQGLDIPILLNSTPEETLAHRKARNRDGGTDSPFTSMVLDIEQGLLTMQAPKAKLILSKNGELLDRL